MKVFLNLIKTLICDQVHFLNIKVFPYNNIHCDRTNRCINHIYRVRNVAKECVLSSQNVLCLILRKQYTYSIYLFTSILSFASYLFFVSFLAHKMLFISLSEYNSLQMSFPGGQLDAEKMLFQAKLDGT